MGTILGSHNTIVVAYAYVVAYALNLNEICQMWVLPMFQVVKFLLHPYQMCLFVHDNKGFWTLIINYKK